MGHEGNAYSYNNKGHKAIKQASYHPTITSLIQTLHSTSPHMQTDSGRVAWRSGAVSDLEEA